MAFDTVSLSSDDDTPLKPAGSSLVPITSTSLKEHSIQHCDFCEEVFLNKYEALIHNAKHIIIPLIKRELHQCPLCLFYFTSRYKLKHHIRNKHKNDAVKLNENVNIKNDVNKSNEKNVNIDNDKHEKNNEKNHVTNNSKHKKDSEKNQVNIDSDKQRKNNEKDHVNIDKEKQKKNNEKDHVNIDNDKQKKNNEKNNVIDNVKHKKDNEKNHVINNGKQKKNNEKNHVIDNVKQKKNYKSKDIEKVITIYESDDDDDLPLVNGNISHAIDETEKGAVMCETSILREALIKDVKVVLEKIELKPEKIEPKLSVKAPENFELKPIHKEPEKIEPKVNTAIPDQIEPKAKLNAIAVPQIKISSRLRFEDDIDDFCDDAVMKDLTTDCIVDMNLFDEPWFDELAKSINNDEIDEVNDDIISIPDDGPGDTREIEDNVVYTPSTHHDDLIKPGVYRCKKCQQMFPTRFNQIQHEMSHMHIRKPRPFLCEHCDRFIANKKALKDHIASKHLTHYRPRTFRNCTKCGLKYNKYEKHLENYHEFLKCHLCNKGFEAEIDRLNHIRGHLVKIKCGQCGFVASELEIQEHKRRFHKAFVSLAVFHLCDVCCLFLKNKHNTHYVFGETVSKLGSRLDCEHCGNKFFHVTQVRRTVKGRPNDRFQFEKEKERKKVLTNTERLKNIQQRLKMINKLSRF